MSKAFEFLEQAAFRDIMEDSESESVSINDAYWACKMFAAEELQKILDYTSVHSKESYQVIIEQRIKQLKSKKIKINES